METFDAILVLGRGIDQVGNLPDSAKATVRKAVELYKTGIASRIIFSGKWSYRAPKPYPITEAEAMASYAEGLGLPKEVTYIEKESDDTPTNIYFTKLKFLIPNSWTRVLLVSVEIFYKRAFLNLRKILGPDYQCEVKLADFSFPEDRREELKEIESDKLKMAEELLSKLKDGDHEAIYQADRKFLGLPINNTKV